MTTPNVAKVNLASFTIELVEGKEAFEQGPFALIHRFPNEMKDAHRRVMHALQMDQSVDKVLRDILGSYPDGEKIMERYESSIGQGKSRTEKETAEVIKKKVKAACDLLRRTTLVLDVFGRLNAGDYDVAIMKPSKNNLRWKVEVRGIDDDPRDAIPCSVAQILALKDKEVMGNIARDLFDSAKKKKSATTKDADIIEPAKIAGEVDRLANTINQFDIAKGKDNGLSKNANAALLLLWARLDCELTDAQKAEARKAFDNGDIPHAEAIAS